MIKRIALIATAWTLLVGLLVSAVASERAPHQRGAIPVRLVPVSRDEQARQTVRVADFVNHHPSLPGGRKNQ